MQPEGSAGWDDGRKGIGIVSVRAWRGRDVMDKPGMGW
jgi:hypothetical protein